MKNPMDNPNFLLPASVVVALLCLGMILVEFTFKEPRIWLILVNAVAIALNVWTAVTNTKIILRKRARRAAGWLVD